MTNLIQNCCPMIVTNVLSQNDEYKNLNSPSTSQVPFKHLTNNYSDSLDSMAIANKDKEKRPSISNLINIFFETMSTYIKDIKRKSFPIFFSYFY